MKLLSALAMGLMLAGPVSAQDLAKGWDAYRAGDYTTALQEWRPLAEQGYANAQSDLGYLYHLGAGVPQDYAEAAKWYLLAAKQGYAKAQGQLGFMYQHGDGMPQDYVIAHMWYNIRAANGSGLGAMNRAEIEERMTREQIAEAQALARRCMASDYEDCG